MKLSNEWNPTKMVEQISSHQTFGVAGLRVSTSVLVLVLGITDEARSSFLRQRFPIKPEHRYIFYREHPDGSYKNLQTGESYPFLWQARFGFFDHWVKRGCPAWWGVYDEENPPESQSELLPPGVDLSEVCALTA